MKLTDKQIEQIITDTMCSQCPYFCRCFDDREPCEKYYDEHERLEKENDLAEVSMFNEGCDKDGCHFIYHILFDATENMYKLEFFYCLRNNSDAETGYEEWFDTLGELRKFVEEL